MLLLQTHVAPVTVASLNALAPIIQWFRESIRNVGALPSDRVARFLADVDLVKKPIVHEQTKQHLPKTKAQERMQEAKDAAKAAAEVPTERATADASPEGATADALPEGATAETSKEEKEAG